MTRKKRPAEIVKAAGDGGELTAQTLDSIPSIGPPSLTPPTLPQSSDQPASSPLVICRNKHWRNISSWSGPWLQLPPEVLQSLAHSNQSAPRPKPIDPSVFANIIKIRKLIEDATDLAVRVANGTTSSTLSISANAGNGILHGGNAAALGLAFEGVGPQAKLSRERKYRMRENATQKLSTAYRLDETAASVATMQSSSTLEDIASIVLERNPNDFDAKYVHFFHEKIPSRSLMLTSLEPLDDITTHRPSDSAAYRTRGIMKVLKQDLSGAIKDFTEGLGVLRLYGKESGPNQLISSRAHPVDSLSGSLKGHDSVEDEEYARSMVMQLLFHRAGAYLALACDYIELALQPKTPDPQSSAEVMVESPNESRRDVGLGGGSVEARKLVRTYAKRSLRDYLSLLAHLDYAPSPQSKTSEDTTRRATQPAGEQVVSSSLYETAEVFEVASLFAAVPPSSLPPYPVEELTSTSPTTTVTKSSINAFDREHEQHGAFTYHEALTYHPLLTDALHSLLLCHCLIQTPNKELLRHACMVARLSRISDGYPIFLAARCPARADWVEVLRRTNNWLGLQSNWQTLCAPAPVVGYTLSTKPNNSRSGNGGDVESSREAESRARTRTRELKVAREEEEEQRKEYLRSAGNGSGHDVIQAQRWTADRERMFTTERAGLIAKWIKQAPAPGSDNASGNGTTRAKKPKRKKQMNPETCGSALLEPKSDLHSTQQGMNSLTIDS